MTLEHWSEWRDHAPGPCPVPVGTLVQVILEGVDMLSPMRADEVCWHCPGDDVTSYRVRQYSQASKLIQSITTKIPEPVE